MNKAQVVLFTRPGCHLCDEAKAAILSARCTDKYTLEETNIETDPELLERYGHEIPVIVINGVEAFKHRVSSMEFRKRILE